MLNRNFIFKKQYAELYVYPVWTKVFCSPDVYLILKETLKVRPAKYFFTKSYREGKWDGYYNFLYKDKFPSGFLYFVKNELEKNGVTTKIIYMYDTNLPKENIENNCNLFDFARDYQIEVIKNALTLHRCIIQLPTNAGKTEIAIMLIKLINKPFLYVLHLKELLYQTKERMEKYGIEVGLIGDGKFIFNQNGNVVMIQSLNNYINYLKNFPVLFIDEVHHYTLGEWYKILLKIESPFRFGLSATPFSNDINDWKLIALTSTWLVGHNITNQFMIDKGYSIPPVIHIYKTNLPFIFGKNYLELIDYLIKNENRNKLIKDIVLSYSGKQILILVNRIEHGRILQQMIPNSVFLCGNDDSLYRLQIKNKFQNKEIKILITTLFGEGIDIPSIEVLVLAYPIASYRHLLQRVGRGMRREEGKKEVIIVDLVDECNDYFKNQFKKRLELYEKEKFKIVYKTTKEQPSLLL